MLVNLGFHTHFLVFVGGYLGFQSQILVTSFCLFVVVVVFCCFFFGGGERGLLSYVTLLVS